MNRKHNKVRFNPSICVTHDCNLNCIYCYQNHDATSRMSFDTAKRCIDDIFQNIPDHAVDGVEIGFIGGEPLLEFGLLKQIFLYVQLNYSDIDWVFYATTNGTLLNDEMKEWFSIHRKKFVLGLSLDGTRETHNINRSNSFDKIDIEFFLRNWPEQGVKMTLSEYSIPQLAENIKFIHSLGFKNIRGVNLAEGTFDWDDDKYIEMLIPQLSELVDFYLESDGTMTNQMFDRHIAACEAKRTDKRKWCGIGTGCPFFDIDGKKYPCAFITPMTFSADELTNIIETDFTKDENFVDDECFDQCYIYPVCATCAGADYMQNKTFKLRDRSRCKIQKLIALFVADLQAKQIVKNPKMYNDSTLYHTIEAIKKIRALYLDEFKQFGL